MDFQQYLNERRERVETFLDKILPSEENVLNIAMRYSALDGGKQLRPMLVYATGEALGAKLDDLDYVAAAVELIHCYSLVHDDLPAMDDDDLRRGKPSCHKAFTEATAILVGDALQSLAFELLSSAKLSIDAKMQLHIIHHLAKACGPRGMALGQALDMNPEDIASVESLENVHLHKTGALIEASVLMGAHAAGCNDGNILNHLTEYSRHIGLAYQIQDDILDLEASTEHLGKPAKSDLKNDKQTYPVLLGIEKAKQQAQDLYQLALDELGKIDLQDSKLANIASYLIQRDG